MPLRPPRGPALFIVILLACGRPSAAAAPGGPTAHPPGSTGEAPWQGADPTLYTPAKSCGTCHGDIHAAWAGSAHARAATSPAYREARARITSPDDRWSCVGCHSPTASITADNDLSLPLSAEGVTCDFCHTVAAVNMDAVPGGRFDTRYGPVKRGPFDYSGGKVRGHAVAYSTLHRGSPLLCAACHEYTNARGVAVLSNYSEWKDSPYPVRGVSCQDCHMAPVPGTVAAGTPPRDGVRIINLHRLVGGSAVSQLARGLDLAIDSVAGGGGSVTVTVSVTNVAAGHAIPGGISTKSLVLAVAAEAADGSLASRQERVYRRELKDERGVVLEDVAGMFLKAAAVGADTRLRPGERRVERFTITVPQNARAVVARLEYRDASDPRQAPGVSLVTETKRPL